ncbi:hypothetical protein DFH09DRAFT_1082666 [Mycena vulgaris]|nr:hypothetical protein DFH09DRAFT_1082666 [Mycena vulgaris]
MPFLSASPANHFTSTVLIARTSSLASRSLLLRHSLYLLKLLTPLTCKYSGGVGPRRVQFLPSRKPARARAKPLMRFPSVLPAASSTMKTRICVQWAGGLATEPPETSCLPLERRWDPRVPLRCAPRSLRRLVVGARERRGTTVPTRFRLGVGAGLWCTSFLGMYWGISPGVRGPNCGGSHQLMNGTEGQTGADACLVSRRDGLQRLRLRCDLSPTEREAGTRAAQAVLLPKECIHSAVLTMVHGASCCALAALPQEEGVRSAGVAHSTWGSAGRAWGDGGARAECPWGAVWTAGCAAEGGGACGWSALGGGSGLNGEPLDRRVTRKLLAQWFGERGEMWRRDADAFPYATLSPRAPRLGSHAVRMASHSCALTLARSRPRECGRSPRTASIIGATTAFRAHRDPRESAARCVRAAQSRIARRHAPACYAREACGASNPARRGESLNEHVPRLRPRKRDAGATHLRLLPHRDCA